MEHNTENKFVFKKFGPIGSAILLLVISAIFFIGAYFNINEHFQRIEESDLSLSLIITAVVKLMFGLFMLVPAIWLIVTNAKNT